MLCNCAADSEQKLIKALSSVWFCDQIVFLADNSTPGSIKIAERFKCEIHHWSGRNSMADRRNYMMQFMKHDYILMCDSDEVYDWSAYYILKDYISRPHEEYIHAVMLINVTEDGYVQSITPLERMFKKGVSWEKDIQNQIKAPTTIGSMIHHSQGVPLEMYHDGYGDQNKHAVKQWKRLPANESMVRKDPEDAHTRMFLINALVVAGAGQPLAFDRILANVQINIEEFEKSGKEPLDCKILQKTLRFYYSACQDLNRWDIILDEVEKYWGHIKFHPDSYYWRFRCNYELRNPKESLKWGESFVKEVDDKDSITKKNIEVSTVSCRDDVIKCMLSILDSIDNKWAKRQKKRLGNKL